ncbi:condensation domain-containing protein [Streptomyces katrae]|uniref:condensation domain-containing protein n=1 Tax=Streptomyces katrae TaxID=68223 RepID=UPI0006975E4B|nr:condensation domain-containing protein [Streptomyces katrae]
MDGRLRWWEKSLAGLEALELPADRPRPTRRSGDGASLEFTLDARLTTRLRGIAEGAGATLFMTLLAGFQATLARYAGSTDIAVGTPVAGRDRVELEPLVGFFVNTVVLRADLSGEVGFRELLGRVRRATVDAYDHQEVPFDRLVEHLSPERVGDRNPLVQVMFASAQDETAGLRLPGLDARAERMDFGGSLFDLSVFVSEGAETCSGSLVFDTDPARWSSTPTCSTGPRPNSSSATTWSCCPPPPRSPTVPWPSCCPPPRPRPGSRPGGTARPARTWPRPPSWSCSPSRSGAPPAPRPWSAAPTA